METLKLVMFQLSNNFVNGPEGYRNIIRLTKQLGLDDRDIIRALFLQASEDFVIAAVLDKLFVAAYKTLSSTLVSILIEENESASNGHRAPVLELNLESAFDVAMSHKNYGLAKAILAPKTPSVDEFIAKHASGIMSQCAGSRDHRFAMSMVLLLGSPENYPKRQARVCDLPPSPPLLLRALGAGNIPLVLWLVENGEDVNVEHNASSHYLSTAADKYLPLLLLVDVENIWTSVIYPSSLRTASHWAFRASLRWNGVMDLDMHRCPRRYSNRCQHCRLVEKSSLHTYMFLRQQLLGREYPQFKATTALALCHPIPVDLLIYAAFFGYAGFIQAVTADSSYLNRANHRGVWPLLAAVLGGDVSTCSSLLILGADPNFVPDFDSTVTANRAHCAITALHQAVMLGLPSVVELLIHSGADVNRKINLRARSRFQWQKCGSAECYKENCTENCEDFCWWCQERQHKPYCIALIKSGAVTALTLALATASQRHDTDQEIGRQMVVKILLQRAAIVGIPDLRLAFECRCRDVLEATISIFQASEGLSIAAPGQLKPWDQNSPTIGLTSCRATIIGSSAKYLTLAAATGSMKAVLWVLSAIDSQRDPDQFSEVLQIAISRGLPDIASELLRRNAQLPSGWLSDAFGTYKKDDLLAAIDGMHSLDREARKYSSRGRSLLEEAMLNPNTDVAALALEMFPQSYDSGALIASFCRSLRMEQTESSSSLLELLRRQKTANAEQMDPVIENGVLALAIYYNKLDVIRKLLERPHPKAMAVIPGPGFWVDNITLVGFSEGLAPYAIVRPTSRLAQHVPSEWNGWPVEDRWTVSPMFMALKTENRETLQELVCRGYCPDVPTFAAAILSKLEIPVLRPLLPDFGSHYYRSAVDSTLATPLYAAVMAKNCQMVQMVTEHSIVIDDYFRHAIFSYGHKSVTVCTALQIAILENSYDIVYHLIHHGADANAPANNHRGKTALQAAAATGNIDLARCLLERGANINAPRAALGGETCLEAAAANGRLDMVQFLLNQGVDTLGKGRFQYLHAIHKAKGYGHAAVRNLLLRHRPLDQCDMVMLNGECDELLSDLQVEDAMTSTSWSPPTLDIILSLPDITSRYRVWLHPDEVSLEERQSIRRWSLENRRSSPFDAELDLLSSEEKKLSSSERDFLIASIMDNPTEITQRFNSNCPLKDRPLNYDHYDEPVRFAFTTSVLLLHLSMLQTVETRTRSPIQTGGSSDNDLKSRFSPFLAQDTGTFASCSDELTVAEQVLPVMQPGPRMPLHPKFEQNREVVDFHEHIGEPV
ncbi:hypothetical protein S40293_09332 [Stachybotrys chartarum IBT 40293]|nr:hypothetical protein S40293_09332 [Stachybotrys chartarum IBT 40293]